MNKLTILLLLLLTIRQTSGEEEDNDECSSLEYKCGDVCVFESRACICGNVILNKYSPEYCCLAPGDNCTTIDYEGVCSQGVVVPKTETCFGACHEDSPSNTTDAQGHTTCHCPNTRGWKKCEDFCAYKWHSCTQQCDPDTQFKCGDVCVTPSSSGSGYNCPCGNVTLYKHSSDYCCLEPGHRCTYFTMSEEGTASYANCSSGTPVPKAQSCYGTCPDNSPSTTTISQAPWVNFLSCNFENSI